MPRGGNGKAPEAAAIPRRSDLATRKPTVPPEIRPLLGPSWIVEGEDPKLYEELLAQVGAAVQPQDLIDWLLLNDIVALTWEIQRTRRHRQGLMHMARHEAMKSILTGLLPPERGYGTEPKAHKLARLWLNGDEAKAEQVNELLAKAGISEAEVVARTLSVIGPDLDRLDQQNERHENRRDALLQQIDRRRAGWSKRVEGATEEIIEGEYTDRASKVISPASEGPSRDEH
jgi:hypothetical protein